MKGTFFTADFVRTAGGDLKLLEINTDTAIQKHLAESKLDFSELISAIQSNSITNVHVIYKNIQKPVVDVFETQLGASAPAVQFNRVVEGDYSVYPTVVEDQVDRLILRLAYDAGAILDSEYAAKDLNLYKLFIDNSDSSKIPGIYYAGSEVDSPVDTLESSFNDNATPDYAVRKYQSIKGNDLSFYKAGNSSLDASSRVAGVKAALGTEGIITNYYKGAGSTASSIRLYQVVYGDSLDIASLGAYEIDAITDYPASIDFDDSLPVSKVDAKHFSEFSVEGINRSGGIKADHSILRFDGGADLASSPVIGDIYKSYFISGSPNTDNYGTLFQWSHAGSTLPEGSMPTGSVMLGTQDHTPVNNAIIKATLASGEVLRLGGVSVVLAHDGGADAIKFMYASSLSTADSLFDSAGQKVAISSLDIELLDSVEESTVHEFNLEETDIYIVSGSDVVLHNAPCFVAGTQIYTSEGLKAIEDVLPGDIVATVDHTDGGFIQERKEVLEVMKKDGEKVITYKFSNGLELKGTPDHPLYVENKGYASLDPALTLSDSGFTVNQIEKGDKVWHQEGNCIEIIDIIDSGETATVYNLKNVEDNHNFFANGFLVHNRSK